MLWCVTILRLLDLKGKKKKQWQPEAETILDLVRSEMRIGFYWYLLSQLWGDASKHPSQFPLLQLASLVSKKRQCKTVPYFAAFCKIITNAHLVWACAKSLNSEISMQSLSKTLVQIPGFLFVYLLIKLSPCWYHSLPRFFSLWLVGNLAAKHPTRKQIKRNWMSSNWNALTLSITM